MEQRTKMQGLIFLTNLQPKEQLEEVEEEEVHDQMVKREQALEEVEEEPEELQTSFS